MIIGVIGDVIMDITVKSHGKLQPGSDVIGEISYQGGGSAANVAAWLGQLGVRVRFSGAVGRDPAAQIAQLALAEFGVETHLVEKEAPTGTILLFLNELGERTMVTSRGANLLLEIGDLEEQFFANLDHLHLTAYSLFGSEQLKETTLAILARAKKLRLPVSLDPSSYALLTEFGREKFLTLTQGVDLLFPNLEEGKVLSCHNEPEAIAQALLDYYPIVILTLGSEGCLCATKSEIVTLPADQVKVRDTTGAGDAFAAGFLAEYLKSGSLHKSALAGNLAASQCVQHLGGRPS